ncbi:MAG: DegT/DnrJ/EryC1/StrS family aminotransferase [Bryobacteraceae bacterium]|nr:DegT/DnrJ/EryC1/StrS family aminotransferase [Bryobacteraceae bacterium]
MAVELQKRSVPLLDFQAQYASIQADILTAIHRVVDSQRFILGEEVEKLEQELAAYTQSAYAVGCGSGSDALLLALMACDVGPGDKVLTAPFTFFASAGTVARLGAIPVFADIDPVTFNLDPQRTREALDRDPKIKAVMPIHLFGGAADMDPILEAARDRDCFVIEDAAQAIGAEYKGRRVGAIGTMGCFSFYPTKNLGGYGEGGLVTTNHEALARRVASLRVHGSPRRYYHDEVGLNSRLDALQAAVLRVKFPHLDGWTAARERNAALYRQALGDGSLPILLPEAAPYQTRHVWNQFSIRVEKRDELQAWLRERGIGTEIYYPLCLHQQACFRSLGYQPGDFPVSEKAAASVLALPVSPELSQPDLLYVCDAIRSFFKG